MECMRTKKKEVSKSKIYKKPGENEKNDDHPTEIATAESTEVQDEKRI